MLSDGGNWANADDPAGRCFNGTWCPSGMTRAPTLATEACPAGNYCPIATANPVPCAAGKYRPFDGADDEEDCSRSLRGYYTIAGASNLTGLCEPGYYCPEGSTGPREVPCPASTYNPYYGRWSDDDCSLCVSGGYCEVGSAFPSVCPRGYFCIAGVSSFAPCPDGTFGNASGLRREEDCSSCSPGYYCDGTGLPRPRGLCDPGYYCIEGSNTSSPNGPNSPSVSGYVPASTCTALRNVTNQRRSVGGICPIGGYCPVGSSYPTACPAGTFGNRSGMTDADDCANCLAGTTIVA